MTITDTYYLVLAAMLFTIGGVGVLVRRNVIVMFMCVELMLNAVNLTFVVVRQRAQRHPTARRSCSSRWWSRRPRSRSASRIIVAIFRRRRGADRRRPRRCSVTASRPRRDLVSARDLLDLVWIVPALPLFGAVAAAASSAGGSASRSPGWIATGLMALAFAWSIVMFVALLDLPAEARVNVHNLFTWLPAGTLQVTWAVYADPLSVTWILLVTGVGTLIHLYSIGYMHGDPRFSRFFAYLNLFAASMLILVLGSTFLVTFLGWEGVGLCSYLLVSFWFERNSAAVAGKKAFVTNRVGDVGFLLAMFLIFASYGTLDYARDERRRACDRDGHRHRDRSAAPARGASGKSAQIPLHIWLPDAMEGPTPVSALIHAATMVTAGRVPAVPRAPVPRGERRRVDGGGVGRRRHRAARGHGRDHAARHQTRARVLHDQPARLHVPRRRRRTRTARPCSW